MENEPVLMGCISDERHLHVTLTVNRLQVFVCADVLTLLVSLLQSGSKV